VGIGLRESADEVRTFGKEFGIEFPLWVDPEGQTAVAFGVWGHPSTVLVDRAGRLVGRLRGEHDWSTPAARRLVETLLAERQQSAK
jgi:peroxiredoxin